jgi:hypothetical protein
MYKQMANAIECFKRMVGRTILLVWLIISPHISTNTTVTCRFKVTVSVELVFSKRGVARAETNFKKLAYVAKKGNFNKRL